MKLHLPVRLFRTIVTLCSLAVGIASSCYVSSAVVPDGYKEVIIAMEEEMTNLDHTEGNRAFLVKSDLFFDGLSSPLMGEDAESWYFSGSSDISIDFEKATAGVFVVADAHLLTFAEFGELRFSGNKDSDSYAVYGGVIYGGESSTITLSDNSSVEFCGSTVSGFLSAYGGVIRGGSNSTITLSGNESVEFSGNTVSDSLGAFGGVIQGGSNSTITLSNNGSVRFSGNSGIAINGNSIGTVTITLSGNESVEFSNNSSSVIRGGSNGTITLSNNGSVRFSGNSGIAIDGNSTDTITITLSGNESVEFSENSSSAIYCGENSTITLSNNGSVRFSGNSGSAIDGNFSDMITITLSDNESVTFSGNSTYVSKISASGGAIYGGEDSTITLSGNGSVTFSGNSAFTESLSHAYARASGGAVSGSTITLSGNESVTFSGNTTSAVYDRNSAHGGAVSGSTITLSGNASVAFSGNTASSSDDNAYGGAIYGGEDSTITLSGNGSVVFCGNMAISSSTYSYAYVCGGAIDSIGNLSIQNNDAVLFEKNAEIIRDTYRLRSIHAGGSGDVISLSAAEDKSIEFRDSLYIASESTVELNADYTDAAGLVHKQTGDIIFSGAYAEQHLNELLSAAGLERSAMRAEIMESLRTEVNALTSLHGGRLIVEDGAIYRGMGITAAERSASTVLLKDASLKHAGYKLIFNEGTTMEFSGSNVVFADALEMVNDSVLRFHVGDSWGSSVLYGSLNVGESMQLQLEGSSMEENCVLLYVYEDVTGWDESRISVSGGSYQASDFTWVDNMLVLNYNADTFSPLIKGKHVIDERQELIHVFRYFEDISFITASFSPASLGGAIYGGENSTITLSQNERVTFSENTADFSNSLNAYGGAIYGGENSAITLSGNASVGFIGNAVCGSITDYETDTYACGGAICGSRSSTIILNENESVVFSGNTVSASSAEFANGGAIYGGTNSTITLSGNGSVEFSGNTASSFSSNAYGGAIDGSTITLNENESVVFCENTASSSDDNAYGGAIDGSTITLNENESVVFCENTASSFSSNAYGGALDGSTITLNENESVVFCENMASSFSYKAYGGAIDGSTITLSGNGSVTFSGNAVSSSSSGYGGAIYGGENSTITLSGNGSVEFSGNAASGFGGAIYGDSSSTIELSDNRSVEFSENKASSVHSYTRGGAVSGSTIMLSGNDSVEFSGNTASGFGGAIYGGENSTITLSGNESVAFNGNTVFSSSSGYGGAIYGSRITLRGNGSVTFSGNIASSSASSYDSVFGGAIFGVLGSTIELSDNRSVTFSENKADNGGAIYGVDSSTITLSGNESVEFSGNTASGFGGAIYGVRGSTIELSDNRSVMFSENKADNGGVIYGDNYSTITLSGNESVEFSGNTTSPVSGNAYGGAISCLTILLSGNERVMFCDNTASSTDSNAYGGAIYSSGNIRIMSKSSVLFEKNAEVSNGIYRLRSIYADGSYDISSLSALAGGKIEFRDSVYIASRYSVGMNADHNGKKQTGDIIFTGKYTEQHLNELLAADGIARTATKEEILNSRTTEVLGMTNLYGGRLRVEDGAVYKGYGITVHEGAAASIRVKDAALEHAGYDITLCFGSTLELQGENHITGTLEMRSGSTLQFLLGEENKGASVISLSGDFVSEGGVTYTLKEYELGTEYRLISMSGNQSGWDTDALSFVGKDGAALNASLFCWDAGTLYFTTEYRIDTEADFHGFDAFPITGSGIYRVSGVSEIKAADRISLGDYWTGTIVLEDCTSGGMELDYYANATSRLVIDGLSGWFGGHSSRNVYVNALLELEDGGLYVTDNSRWTYHFNGGIRGAGDFVVSTRSAYTPTYILRGDLSGWDGAFRVQQSAKSSNAPTVSLQLTDGGGLFSGTEGSGVFLERLGTLNVIIGNADAETMMQGAIINTGVERAGTREYGELNLTVNHATTFNGSVDVTKLTLAAGATAAFNESMMAESVEINKNAVLSLTGNREVEQTIGALSGSGNLSVNSGSERQVVNIASISAFAGSFSVSGANSTLALNLAAQDVLTASRVTLASNAMLVLGGCGTYDLSGGKNLASGVSLGEGWSGIVRLSGAVLTGDSLAGLSNADSIVELVGVSGYLSRADSVAGVTHDLNLKLTNAGEISALSITDGYQKDKHIFTGSVCGTGTFARATSKCGTLTYIFTGDVSDWEGKFSHAPEKDIGTAGLACTLLTFNGSREVNAAVTTNGNGELHVTVDDEHLAVGEKVTMNGSITADTLTVTEGTRVNLKSAVSVDTLRTAGTVDLASGIAIDQGETTLVTREEADMALFFGIESTEDSLYGLREDSVLRHVSISGGAEYLMQNLELENVSYTAEQSALTLRQVEFTGNCMFSVGATGTILLDEATLLLSVGSLEESADGVLELDYSDLFHCTASGELEITMDKDVDSLLSAGYNSITLNLGDDVNYDNLNLTLKGATYTGNSQGVAQFALLAVPEPTSATLSLLALAALAARRRRK